MKNILFRLLVAAALTLAAFALSSPAHGQEADEDSTPTDSKPQARDPKSPTTGAAPSSGDQTQDELAFTGRIEQEKGNLVLRDPVTRLTYQLDDQMKARKFIAKQVRVIGKLEMKSNTIQVSRIERIP